MDCSSQAACAAPDMLAPRHARRWSDGLRPADGHWSPLVAALAEQAVDSTRLLGRAIDHLVGAGRLRHAEAQPLRDALEALRGASRCAQQITRLASGRIRSVKDRVSLAEAVRTALDERVASLGRHGISVSTELAPVDVLLDPAAGAALAAALLDWCLARSSAVTLRIQAPAGQGPACLTARTTHRRPSAPAGRRVHDGLDWMLLQQLAAASDLPLRHARIEGGSQITLTFPKVFHGSDGVASVELLPPVHHDGVTPLDALVLVVAAEDALRRQACVLLEGAGLESVGVPDLAGARRLLAQRHASVVVVGPDVDGPEMFRLRSALQGTGQPCPVVEISAGTPSFQSTGFMGLEVARVGRDTLARELVPSVLFELARLL